MGGHYNPLGKNHGPHKIPKKVTITNKVIDPATNNTVDVPITVDMDPVLNDGSDTVNRYLDNEQKQSYHTD